MKFNKKWRPKSWSVQAREMADNQIKLVTFQVNSIEYAKEFFSKSYRPKIIRYRAAKRFGKWLKTLK